jgi:hypothetical protein
MMHLFSCESPSLELNFWHLSLNLSCGLFPEKSSTPPPTPPPAVLVVSCILPKVLSFYLCCSPCWSVLLVRKPGRCLTSLNAGGVSHTFPHSLNLRDTVSPQTGLLRGFWGVIRLPFCLPKAGLICKPGFLPGSRAFSRSLCLSVSLCLCFSVSVGLLSLCVSVSVCLSVCLSLSF